MLHRRLTFALLLCCSLAASCNKNKQPAPPSGSAVASMQHAPTPSPAIHVPSSSCKQRREEILSAAPLPGAAAFDRNRIEILGRVRGEPVIFLSEPSACADSELSPAARSIRSQMQKDARGSRVVRAARAFRGSKAERRALFLREGYVYASDPLDALAMVSSFRIADFFDDAEIYMMRASSTYRLLRDDTKREVVYRYAEGSAKGAVVDLTFADRFGLSEADLSHPLHRDVKQLAWSQGFDRMKLGKSADDGFIAELRFGDRWVKSVIDTKGASCTLRCIDEEESVAEQIARYQQNDERRRRALARIRESVSTQVEEALRFDRPEGVKTADEDGRLRPGWLFAYRHEQSHFVHEKHSYPVYDSLGRAWPPQVCVDFVLDTFERASGTWYRPKPQSPKRLLGGVDFDATGIKNRRSVLAFEQFAVEHGELFQSRRIPQQERIAFESRSRFFDYLLTQADEFRDADIVAIQGKKKDGLIHQHAILIESVDPVTGFPHGLADQMKRPRRRTWEGIMAEAPLRSLLYHIRLNEKFFVAIADSAVPTVAE